MQNKPASLLVVPLEYALISGFPHFSEVDRWLATLKRARIAHGSLSRDRRIKYAAAYLAYLLLTLPFSKKEQN